MSEGIGEGSPRKFPTDTNTTGIITAPKPTRAIFFKDIFLNRIYHNQFDNCFGNHSIVLKYSLLSVGNLE